MSNHIKFVRFVLLAISEEEKHDFHFFVQCIIKQLLDSVSDIQNNQGLGKDYLDLDYSGYH